MQFQPHKLLEQSQKRIVQLEQENEALQAEIVDLQQQMAIAESTTALNLAVEAVTFNRTLPAEILLRQRSEAALEDSDRLFSYMWA